MTDTDKLLERIIEGVNKSGEPLDITITTNGTVITGRLAPRRLYLEANIRKLTDNGYPSYADEFANEGGSLDNADYVHLTEAKLVFEGDMMPASGTAIRVATANVQAWHVGRLERRDD
ncbi:hypothetical protein [Streptomyces chartreusis]|uniref:hypothetical protein n=1 Tax=Streptomyces chartreusis TaxID=1969 RepID=UPI0037F20AE0